MLRMIVLVFTLCCFIHQSSVGAQEQRIVTTENFRVHRKFHSEFLRKDRDIFVWLPPGYDSDSSKRYPVLYLQDGANLFANWRIDQTALALIASKQAEPLIMVGIDHGGSADDRFEEYTPTRDSMLRKGGKADLYGRMLIEELKPFIDSQYRTLTNASNTALGGSSLGGLVSLYLGLQHPGIFGKVAAISPSVWWDKMMIVNRVKALSAKTKLLIWLDVGTNESGVKTVRQLLDALTSKGWVLNEDLMYVEAKGAGHDEKAWAERAGEVLKYLFPQVTRSGYHIGPASRDVISPTGNVVKLMPSFSHFCVRSV